jgi:glycosyltransferase involved in cell wall biosynthesis
MTRKTVLVLSFFPAYFPPTSGGEMRLFSLYDALSADHDVILISSAAPDGEVERILHNINFIEYRVPKGSEFYQVWSELAPFQGHGDLSAIAVAMMGDHATKLHEVYLENYAAADVIIHDFPFTAPYDLLWNIDSKPRFYLSHNAEHVLYGEMYSDPAAAALAEFVKTLEADVVRDVDLVGYCSHADLVALRTLADIPDDKALFLPNGITLSRDATARAYRKTVKSVLFLGSSHKPNLEAARFIVDVLAPALPQIVFEIVGKCLPPGDYAANVRRHGFVDAATMSKIFARCDAAINPMTSGSGSNVKVFDFVKYDLPIVSTSFGMRGVELVAGRDYVVAEIEDFVATLGGLMRDGARLGQMAASAREGVIANHDWLVVARRLSERVTATTGKGQGVDLGGHVLALNDYDITTAVGGGATRFRGNFAAVAARAPVIALCFSEDDRLTYTVTDDGFHVFAVPKTTAHQAEEQRTNALFYVSATDVLCARFVLDNPLLVKLYDILRAKALRVVSEHPFMTPLPVSFGDRFIYSSQNDERLLKERLFQHHPEGEVLTGLVRDVEARAVEAADVVVTVSDEDAATLLEGRRVLPPVITVRNGVPSPRSKTKAGKHGAAARWDAVFIGSAHSPNYHAARFIVEVLAPACPDVTFKFIGSVCGGLEGELPGNVVLMGQVPDDEKSAALWSSAVALNPMSSGSGSNVKLAEYFAHGLPVLTTRFGVRGYPAEAEALCVVRTLEEFVEALIQLRGAPAQSPKARQRRLDLFDATMSVERLGEVFADLVLPVTPVTRRVLFVTYRWTWPSLGGSEAAMLKYLQHLALEPGVSIDVVANDVTGIASHYRFGGRYTSEKTSAPQGGFRGHRFPTDDLPDAEEREALHQAWEAQVGFEKAWISELGEALDAPMLGWGWHGLERWEPTKAIRWFAGDGSVFVGKGGGRVRLCGEARRRATLTLLDESGAALWSGSVSGAFELEVETKSRWLLLRAPTVVKVDLDPRPLVFALTQLAVDGKVVSLETTAASRLQMLAPESLYSVLARAAEQTRARRGVALTPLRGPRSIDLEAWLEAHIDQYDLVITHNPVFYAPVLAVELAAKAGVPSVMVPHVHLDDDFYHFPDALQAMKSATVNLTCPQAAVDFLREIGANAAPLTPGIDFDETFSAEDEQAFLDVCGVKGRFVLVLGRKAGAKNYADVIRAVDSLRSEEIKVVLIGPDDDGLPVTSPNAIYLGRQPRPVVRGALRRAAALVNMSNSESFGIVILEAWRAGCPVIVSRASSAFRELVQDGASGTLTEPATLAADIRALLADPAKARRMAERGSAVVRDYDWREIGKRFADYCLSLVPMS